MYSTIIMADVNTKTALQGCRAVGNCVPRDSAKVKSVHHFHYNLYATLGLIGAALRASGVAGDSGTAFRTFAELGCFPCLGCQSGALLHLGRSTFRSCHNVVSGLRLL